jgi:hypothetical protein
MKWKNKLNIGLIFLSSHPNGHSTLTDWCSDASNRKQTFSQIGSRHQLQNLRTVVNSFNCNPNALLCTILISEKKTFFKNCFLLRKGRLTSWDFIYDTQLLLLPPLRKLWGKPGSNPELQRCILVSPSCLRQLSHHIPKQLSHHIPIQLSHPSLDNWATTSPDFRKKHLQVYTMQR